MSATSQGAFIVILKISPCDIFRIIKNPEGSAFFWNFRDFLCFSVSKFNRRAQYGRQLITELRGTMPDAEITAVGTNTLATASMLKAGADNGATGENAVIVCTRGADVIVGPIGIVIADSLLGEVTPKMAAAVGASPVRKILLPVNKCNNIIVGTSDKSTSELIAEAVRRVKAEI